MRNNCFLKLTSLLISILFFAGCSDNSVNQPEPIIAAGKWATTKTQYNKEVEVATVKIQVEITDTIAFQTKKIGNDLWLINYDLELTSGISDNITKQILKESNNNGIKMFSNNKISLPLSYKDEETSKEKFASGSILEITIDTDTTATVRYKILPVNSTEIAMDTTRIAKIQK